MTNPSPFKPPPPAPPPPPPRAPYLPPKNSHGFPEIAATAVGIMAAISLVVTFVSLADRDPLGKIVGVGAFVGAGVLVGILGILSMLARILKHL